MKIVFFNHYHNGDIFASKGYISDLINELKGHELFYQHFNSPKLLKDLNIEFVSLDRAMGNFTNRTPFAGERDTIYINTWIGNYITPDGMSWKAYHKMFNTIYSLLSNEMDRSIDMGKEDYYFPTIDYSYFDVPDIDINRGSVIISNGPVLSGQSELENINSVIEDILNKTNRDIYLTNFAPFNSERIFYTSNLIKTSNGDLNEISWIAERCEYIIGRNSGPYCFMHTKSILNDSNKKIISIGTDPTVDFLYKINVAADHSFVYDRDIDSVIDKIKGE